MTRIMKQKDLQQNESFNSFQSRIKTNDSICWEHLNIWNTRNGTQCKLWLSHWNIGIVYCTCGHFFHKEKGSNQKFINYTMTFFQSLSMSSKNRKLHGHRYDKKSGDKKYHTTNQSKKKCKKMYFQGIQDRFIRDPEFRHRMIENHREKEICRRWDTLADEDHTHHFTKQEYFFIITEDFVRTSKAPILRQWRTGLTSNKHCLSCNNWNNTLTEIKKWHRVLLLGGTGKYYGGLLIPMKVTMETNQVLTECGCLLTSIWNNLSVQNFLE